MITGNLLIISEKIDLSNPLAKRSSSKELPIAPLNCLYAITATMIPSTNCTPYISNIDFHCFVAFDDMFIISFHILHHKTCPLTYSL